MNWKQHDNDVHKSKGNEMNKMDKYSDYKDHSFELALSFDFVDKHFEFHWIQI